MTAHDDLPTVSVVIPVRNDEASLRNCLAAIARQTYPSDHVQVLVADSASDPPVGAQAGYEGIEVVRVERPGSYSARNAALEQATGDVIAFTDADCIPHENWIENGVDSLVAGADRVAGKIEVFVRHPSKATSVELLELMFAFPQQDFVAIQGFGATANLLAWRRVVDDVGYFDAGLASGGDVEWGRRATDAGLSLVHDPSVVVRHPARRTLPALARQRLRTIRGLAELEATGRLHYDIGLRGFLLPGLRLSKIWADARFQRRERVRIAMVAVVEDLVAAYGLARFRFESNGRITSPRR